MRIKIIKANTDSLWYSEKHENCIGRTYIVLEIKENKYGLCYLVKTNGYLSYTVEAKDCIVLD